MKVCPNISCVNHTSPGTGWYVKNGYYKPKITNQKTPRYQCKACGKNFSTHSFSETIHQKKPNINDQIFKYLVSGVSLRRASILIGVEYNTVVAKFEFMAQRAKEIHLQHLKTIKTSYVQVDELETYQQSKAKPLSVPMVVRVKTGEILGFGVAKMPAKGLLASLGASKYGWSVDERSTKFQSMLIYIKGSLTDTVTFKSVSNTSYNKWITNIIPNATHETIVSANYKSTSKDKKKDPLFAINNTFAKMRHDMNRLSRKTWSTTKAIHGLENHIWLYIAWNNKYKIK